ncbi:MAG: hypothetical protein ABR587_15365, partial [Candidatus Binatia bacterium]
MTFPNWSLQAAAALVAMLCSGRGEAGQPPLEASAQLDRILKVAADFPVLKPEIFETCAPFSDNQRTFYEDFWCHECRESGPGWEVSYRFFPDPDRGACTLQQTRFVLDDRTLLDSLSRQLSAAWSQTPRQIPFVDKDHMGLAKSVGMPHRWRLAGSRAWMYRDQETSSLVFLWRQDRLTAILDDSSVWSSVPERKLLFEACQQAGDDGCAMLADEVYQYWSPKVPPEAAFRRNLSRLAALRPDDPSYPARLYWTDKLGRTLAHDERYEAESNDYGHVKAERRAEALNNEYPDLAPLGASFGWGNGIYEYLAFNSHFGERLREKFLHDRWGRQAYLESLRDHRGGYDCETGLERAQEAVTIGEEFLARYPETETSDGVRLALAEAYETWWSLSKSGSESGYDIDNAVAKPGAAKAHERALALYRHLAKKFDASLWLKDKIF